MSNKIQMHKNSNINNKGINFFAHYGKNGTMSQLSPIANMTKNTPEHQNLRKYANDTQAAISTSINATMEKMKSVQDQGKIAQASNPKLSSSLNEFKKLDENLINNLATGKDKDGNDVYKIDNKDITVIKSDAEDQSDTIARLQAELDEKKNEIKNIKKNENKS